MRVRHAKRDPRMLRQLQEFVAGLQGVNSVEINPVTGSILVHYQPESHEEIQALLRQANDAPPSSDEDLPPALFEADELAEKIEREAEFLSHHSELAFHVVNAVKSLNKEIRSATGNTVDLKVLLPAGLAVWAFFKAGAEISTPLWVTLGIFSFNSFVALHHHVPPARVTTHTTTVTPG